MTITKFEDGSTLRFLSVAAEVLTAANVAPKSTKILELCRNFRTPMTAQQCLANLCELGLLQYSDDEDTFSTTKKGKSFLEDYKRLQMQLL